MVSIQVVASFIDILMNNSYFLGLIFSTLFASKSFILAAFIAKEIKSKKNNFLVYLLIFALIGSLGTDCAWIFHFLHLNILSSVPYWFYISFIRFAWIFDFMQDISIALFIEHLVSKTHQLTLRQKIFVAISLLFLIPVLIIGVMHTNCNSSLDRSELEIFFFRAGSIFLNLPFFITSVLATIYTLRKTELPRLITKQLKLLTVTIFLPFWFSEIIQIFPLNFAKSWVTNSYTFVALSNIILTAGIFYCSRKIIGLRFLNFQEHVAIPVNINFVEHFKVVLEQFSYATNLHQLNHITQNFFKEAFDIPINHTALIIRNTQVSGKKESMSGQGPKATLVEDFLVNASKKLSTFIKSQKVLNYDEISFSNFYEATQEREQALALLEAINADIFLPIYEKNIVVGYIVVDRFKRKQEFYSKAEYDEMLVFASYLANMITLLQNKDLDYIIQQEKTLREELYSKHQEINQYKESIRSSLHAGNEKSIGIIFYKNRQFSFGNQTAKELININPNIQEGHPLTKAIRTLAQKVELYKSTQSCMVKDAHGNKLMIDGVPSLDNHNVILLIYHPEIADLIKNGINMLKDPSHWDYLLYLESTQSGKLINQLIPGTGETLLNFKIMLLKTALSKKATLIDVPEEDLLPVVELIHHISLRDTLRVMDLKQPSQNSDIAIQLFGLNSVFGTHQEKCILEQLNNTGTLFIKNVHYLDLETQEYLADFIRFGFFKVFRGDQKILSNVRVICSSNQDLLKLTHEGLFSPELYKELSKTTLIMPSLLILPEEELTSLAQAYSEQALPHEDFKELLSLTEQDKQRLTTMRPVSLKELRSKVQTLLTQKTKKHSLNQATGIDMYQPGIITEPDLMEAVRLGKHALKDRKVFTMLWNKFRNQNKIATLLGVNRSSVNRRCKMYDLQD